MQTAPTYTYDFVMNELKTKSIHTKYPYASKKTNNKTLNMSLGRIFFNESLPEDYPLINEPVTQNKLDDLTRNISLKYKPEEACRILSDLQRNFYQIGTLSPSTLEVGVFMPPQAWIDKKKIFEVKAKDYNPVEFQKAAVELTTELVKFIEDSGFRIHNILKGGIKGSPIDDWKNLLVGKGYVIDLEGNLLGPITHGISEGFTKQEYFNSAAEARRGFYYKASLTAIPGYLARKITMSSANVTLANKDCNTKKYYEIYVTKENIGSLVGRYIMEGNKLTLTTQEILLPYLNKTMKLRSPLFCQSKLNQICPICFGTLAEKLDTKRLGILAAGVVNLITINALMKMRHKTSQIAASDVDFPKILANTNIDVKTINLYLDVQPQKIVARRPCRIEIDKKEYHDNEIVETSTYYQVPGILTLSADDLKESITLPFDFQVKLFKSLDTVTERNVIQLNYDVGETVLSQEYIIEQTDPNVIRKLFDNGFKYLKTPEKLTEQIFKQMPSADMCYVEVIVQNMFRSKTNSQINCRLTHYKDCNIYSQKQLPFLNSWVNSLTFENIDKGVKKGLLSEIDIRHDPIENIVMEDFLK
jgi:hypothetical protein